MSTHLKRIAFIYLISYLAVAALGFGLFPALTMKLFQPIGTTLRAQLGRTNRYVAWLAAQAGRLSGLSATLRHASPVYRSSRSLGLVADDHLVEPRGCAVALTSKVVLLVQMVSPLASFATNWPSQVPLGSGPTNRHRPSVVGKNRAFMIQPAQLASRKTSAGVIAVNSR